MTNDEALKRARDLHSIMLVLPHNDEAAELLAGALLALYDRAYTAGYEAGQDAHYCLAENG